jgi:hypothetical protein
MRENSGKSRRYQKPDGYEPEHGPRCVTNFANVEHHSAFENDDRDRSFYRDPHHVAQKIWQNYGESGFAKDQTGKQKRPGRGYAKPFRKYLRGRADEYYKNECRKYKKDMVAPVQTLDK